VNINLGAPYVAAIKSIIEKGYAESQTEVIRQAILAYKRMIFDKFAPSPLHPQQPDNALAKR